MKKYDISKDVLAQPASVTVGQLLKDSPYYHKQLKKALIQKKRLAFVARTHDVMMIDADQGASCLDIVVQEINFTRVSLDGGSGVCIMIDSTARLLGLVPMPMGWILHMANSYPVIPVGVLVGIAAMIGNRLFKLNFLVMQPLNPTSF